MATLLRVTVPRTDTLRPSCCIALLAGLCLLTLLSSTAHAQIESGQVVDDSTGAPLVGSRVLLQHDTAGTWKTIQTTHTDERGLFQFAAYPPGVYRVALLGASEPRYFGAPDTLAADSMQQREFTLPIVRRSAASAYLASEVEQRAKAIVMPVPPPPPGGTTISETELHTSFIVDADGTVDISSFRAIGGVSGDLLESIRQSMSSRRFHPATIGGIPVRQIVEETVRIGTSIRRIGGR